MFFICQGKLSWLEVSFYEDVHKVKHEYAGNYSIALPNHPSSPVLVTLLHTFDFAPIIWYT